MMNRFTLMCDNPYTTCIRAERELNKLMGEVDKLRQVKDRLLEENTRLKAERDKAVGDYKVIAEDGLCCVCWFEDNCHDTEDCCFKWRELEGKNV